MNIKVGDLVRVDTVTFKVTADNYDERQRVVGRIGGRAITEDIVTLVEMGGK